MSRYENGASARGKAQTPERPESPSVRLSGLQRRAKAQANSKGPREGRRPKRTLICAPASVKDQMYIHLRLSEGRRSKRTFISVSAKVKGPNHSFPRHKWGTNIHPAMDINWKKRPREGQSPGMPSLGMFSYVLQLISSPKEAPMHVTKRKNAFISDNSTSWTMNSTEEEAPRRWRRSKRQREPDPRACVYEAHVKD